ncbi:MULTISPECIES: SDR family oxidoreductase [unclassified Clostridium]|uniref:SDR family NAD(P)-dependent oxidoreductase n=1 Tax=unclassified Clostridium TaxID=2614128 RepID=UPI00189A684A|nr:MULTISPECIES: SDR family oxidoreductase [unclassified Clostridium]MBP3917226.1 SDR family oxidoreductase [Clostridium sp.]MEE0931492.1 SDR family oxidoreductase [Clostridium sp.]
MTDSNIRYTLITGASTGIGYELSKLFAKDKHNLILVSRNKIKLQSVKNELLKYNIDIKILGLDLASSEDIKSLFSYIEINKLNVNILVNNAGIGTFGDFNDIEWEKEEALIDINIKALTQLTKYFLPKIVECKNGGILNVASTAAFCSGPRMAAYYASKAYVLNLTEAIYEEYKDNGIKISCLCPGPVKTSFQGKAGIKKSEAAKKYLMDAEEVAKVCYKDFNKGKLIIIPGMKNRLLVMGNKILPRSISRKIILKTNRK